jgi:hypothetical protein
VTADSVERELLIDLRGLEAVRVRPERLDAAAEAMTRVAAQWDRRLARIKRLAESVQAETGINL